MRDLSIARFLVFCGALIVPASASAFCGFYVSGADAELMNSATMVVLMREGTHTVLSMQNDYQGPPEDFALVVPVPVVLSEDDVRTLPRDVFETVERVAAPRLVEYWEQDPCSAGMEGTIGLGNLGAIGHGAGGGGILRGAQPTVVVEAEFAVGEYDIVILSASDSSGLEDWLRGHDYRIPEGAASVLRPYVEAGTKFFVAKVAVERVHFEDGHALLSPLRVHYESDELALPIRLGQFNSPGTQDLIVNVLARNQRYEVANRPNATMLTNVDLAESARERFGEVYAALFDRVVEQHPGAVVTEYAWQATTCDPCPPGSLLSEQDLATLGGDVAFPGQLRAAAGGGTVRTGAAEVRGSLSREIIRRVVRRHINEVRFCYENQLTSQPSLSGRISIRFIIGSDGSVQTASVASSSVGDQAVESCIAQAVHRWTFPAPEAATVVVTYPFMLMPGGGAPSGFGSRAGLANDMVLTRLHYRYGRDGSDEDLDLPRGRSDPRRPRDTRRGREPEPGGDAGGGQQLPSALRHPAPVGGRDHLR